MTKQIEFHLTFFKNKMRNINGNTMIFNDMIIDLTQPQHVHCMILVRIKEQALPCSVLITSLGL